jgi:hypothetical protein
MMRDLLLYALLLWFCCSWLAAGLLWAVLRVTRVRHGSRGEMDEVDQIGEKIVIVSRFESPGSPARRASRPGDEK